jgi:hypothetical protein
MQMSRNTGTKIRADQGPWRTTECSAHYFLLDADEDRLKKVVDDGLNNAIGSARFRVKINAVAMTFQEFKNMHVIPAGTLSPRLNYLEAAFFIMVEDTSDNDRVYVWAPFMYCTDTLATISGREVFGFPKEYSDLRIDGKRFSVLASGIESTASAQPTLSQLSIVKGGVLDPLIEVSGTQILKAVDLAKIRKERKLETLGGFWGLLGGFDSQMGAWVNLLINPAIHFVLHRNHFNTTTGLWQSQLLTAESPVHQFSFERFVVPLDFVVADTLSHPVVSQLGLITNAGGAGTLTPLFGCKIALDFSLNSPKPL